MLKDSRVLVTGGAGFIGSTLVRELLSRGARVRVADDFSRGSIENLEGFTDRIEFLRLDLTKTDTCLKACEGVDYVFHLAASVGGIPYIEKANVEGSTPSLLMNTNMLEAARRCDVKRFLFTSSACVYRERSRNLNRFKEEDAYPANPATTYGWAKLVGEIQCKSYSTDYGLKSVSARIFNAFGERESLDPKSAHVVPSLVRKALRYPREEFIVFGDGKQERAFLYTNDCAEGLVRCIERVEDGSAVNLGSEEVVSIADVAKHVVALSGKKIEIRFDPLGPQGTHRYCADTTKMRAALGWRPNTPFLTGLKNMFDWARRKI
jgi:nucleoside-diphosphate-sugar epimerase